MQNRKKHLDIYLAILALFAVLTSILRSIAASTQLDYTYGHYTSGVLISVADWLTFGGCVILISYVALLPSASKYRASFTTEKTYVPSALVSASLIFLAVSLAADTATELRPFYIQKLLDVKAIMPLASALLAIVAVYYFFLNAYVKDCKSNTRAAASFIAILFMCIYPAYLYFNADLPINAPNKVVDQLAYLFSAVFFLYEARISLGRDRWGLYAAFGMVAALLTAYSALPSFAVYFIKGEIISNSLAENLLTLSLFIFIVSRLLLMRSLADDAPTDLVVKITERTAARRLEIGDSDIIPAQSGEQMEFDMSLLNEESAESENRITVDSATDDAENSERGENHETAEELLEISEDDTNDSTEGDKEE